MTVSILDNVISQKIKTTEGLRDYFGSINLLLFGNILSGYEKEESYYIVMYILYAYSEESPYLINRANSEKEQQAICTRLQMPEYIQGWVLVLPPEKPNIRTAIIDYLEYFAGELWRNLQYLKMQLRDIQKIITNKESTDKGNTFSIKKHMDCIKESNRLATLIDFQELEVKSRCKYVSIGKNEAKKAVKQGQGIGVENSLLIK